MLRGLKIALTTSATSGARVFQSPSREVPAFLPYLEVTPEHQPSALRSEPLREVVVPTDLAEPLDHRPEREELPTLLVRGPHVEWSADLHAGTFAFRVAGLHAVQSR